MNGAVGSLSLRQLAETSRSFGCWWRAALAPLLLPRIAVSLLSDRTIVYGAHHSALPFSGSPSMISKYQVPLADGLMVARNSAPSAWLVLRGRLGPAPAATLSVSGLAMQRAERRDRTTNTAAAVQKPVLATSNDHDDDDESNQYLYIFRIYMYACCFVGGACQKIDKRQ